MVALGLLIASAGLLQSGQDSSQAFSLGPVVI
jgi:hypothetical protein